MSHDYTGNPASFPATITLPDDLDDEDATSVNVAFEALGDAAAFLKAHALHLDVRVVTATTAGAITVPDRCAGAFVFGYGGGGQGGGGGTGPNAANSAAVGASGGAAARASVRYVSLTPGDVLDAEIGAGGSGGIVGQDGGDGGDTVLAVSGGAELTRFRGAQGGHHPLLLLGGGVAVTATGSTNAVVCPGGRGTAGGPHGSVFLLVMSQPITGVALCDAEGGASLVSTTLTGTVQATAGATSEEGFSGGAGGAKGALDGTYWGAGGGGGGAGGPGGVGGGGGAGGAGGSAGNGGTASVGGAAAANTGAGGGGGGSGGAGSTGGGLGAAGGAGGSGKMVVMLIRESE